MTNSIKAAPEVRKLGDYLVKVLNKRQSAQLCLLTGLWLIVTIGFAICWLRPAHSTGPIRFAFNSFILAWGLLMPGYYFYFLCWMKKPNPEPETTFYLAGRHGYDTSAGRAICQGAANVARNESADAGAIHLVGR